MYRGESDLPGHDQGIPRTRAQLFGRQFEEYFPANYRLENEIKIYLRIHSTR